MKTNFVVDFTIAALLFVVLIFAGFLTTYYGAFVLIKMWTWFILPMGLVELTQRSAIGIMVITNLMTLGVAMAATRHAKNEDDTMTGTVLTGLARQAGVFLVISLFWLTSSIWNWWLP